MRADMAASCAEMIEAVGAKNVTLATATPIPGISIHEMGGARMGRDPRTSVLNAYNQAHDGPNCTSGACMTSSGNQNPSLTYMALTARARAYAVEQLRDGKTEHCSTKRPRRGRRRFPDVESGAGEGYGPAGK